MHASLSLAQENIRMSDSLRAFNLLKRAEAASRSNYDSMLIYAQQAEEYAEKADALHLKGEAFIQEGMAWYFKGIHDSALSKYFRAVRLFQSIQDPGGEAQALNEIGVLYRKQADLNKAESVLKRAIQLSGKAGDNSALASAYNNLSEVYTIKGAFDSSLILIRKSNGLKIRNKDEYGLSYNFSSMGINFAEMGIPDSAFIYMKKALDIRKKFDDQHGLAIAYANLGEVAMMQEDNEQAVKYIDSALGLAKEIGYKDLIRHLHFMLSSFYEKTKNFDKSLFYYKKYKNINDSIFNETRSKQLLELQTKYETAEKDKKIAEQQLAVKRRNIWLGLSGGTVLLLVITLALFAFYKRKKEEYLQKEANLKEELARQEMLNRVKNERLRISRDLHDNIGAELTMITSALDSKAYATQDEREKEWLGEVSNYSRQAMSDLRETIWAFKTDAMPVTELASKVQEFASKMTRVSDIEIKIENRLHSDIYLTPGQSINLYRISQEAIQNALKYSGAKEIRWIIREENEKLILEIQDDGVGFDMQSIKKGYGLNHICERMDELSGECQIISRPGQGTHIMAMLPINANTI